MTAERRVSFDGQAADFDRRAGLPPGAGRRIARAVAGLAPSGRRGVLLDLGAGTGQVGEHLARAWGSTGGSRYLGIDLSGPMLAVFRRKLGAAAGCTLVRADGGAVWPLASGVVHLLFLSRAVHLLPPDVVVRETLRLAGPGGAVIVLGGVEAPPESLRAVLRREMRRLLSTRGGVEPRRAGAARRSIADALERHGGEVLPVVTAASWTVVHRASAALAAWRAKPGLGGRAVPARVQEDVLRRLEAWIRARYGDLDVTEEATERYQLTAIRVPYRSDQRPGGTT